MRRYTVCITLYCLAVIVLVMELCRTVSKIVHHFTRGIAPNSNSLGKHLRDCLRMFDVEFLRLGDPGLMYRALTVTLVGWHDRWRLLIG
jgi:hypothetical protein